MPYNAIHRTSVILSLIPEQSDRLLDVGSGPITSLYPYAGRARETVCIDWKLKTFGSIPGNITLLEGDFTSLELPSESFDTIIAADVFEHVAVEYELAFIEKCGAVLKPSGTLVLSVPHKGTFAWLDPYQIKPALHRMLWRVGLFDRTHNGYCDIRKGHNHYTVQELAALFTNFEITRILYSGYFFDPLLSWASVLARGTRSLPGYRLIERACRAEYDQDYGDRSFNVAIQFRKRSL
jgi:SAM-dependent methyltransferase